MSDSDSDSNYAPGQAIPKAVRKPASKKKKHKKKGKNVPPPRTWRKPKPKQQYMSGSDDDDEPPPSKYTLKEQKARRLLFNKKEKERESAYRTKGLLYCPRLFYSDESTRAYSSDEDEDDEDEDDEGTISESNSFKVIDRTSNDDCDKPARKKMHSKKPAKKTTDNSNVKKKVKKKNQRQPLPQQHPTNTTAHNHQPIAQPKQHPTAQAQEQYVFDNSIMPKINGRVRISKFSYHPEYAVKDDTVLQLIGPRAIDMSEQLKKNTIQWYKQLKVQAGMFCKHRIGEEIVSNCARLGYEWEGIPDIQAAWAGLDSQEERDIVGPKIHRVLKEGYFERRAVPKKSNWKYKLEEELLDRFQLEYLPEEVDLKRMDAWLDKSPGPMMM
jgi:hypothetical protein